MEHSFVPELIVLQPAVGKKWFKKAYHIAEQYGLDVYAPDDPNTHECREKLCSIAADLFILAGYGKILKRKIIVIPRVMTINLHGGKLPEYRGSSPMNWSLINGETTFGISIIKVDSGVDTGDILAESIFSIGQDDTIRDLHNKANKHFPEMLVEVLGKLSKGELWPKKQDTTGCAYYPLRFPEDGLILWDRLTANEVHNRVRALTLPYPCAYTYYGGRKVKLIASRLRKGSFYGEPGRIYLIKNGSFLVCAKDKCLWIESAIMEDNGQNAIEAIKRYGKLATIAEAVEMLLNSNGFINGFIR